MTRYEIFYSECDDWGEYSYSEIFDGTWSELQERIKGLREVGCYHIDASALYELDGSADELEARLNYGI